MLKNGAIPASFRLFWGLFKQTIELLQQINDKKCQVHPVYRAGFQTQDLSIMSSLPLPLDQSSLPS